VTQHHEGLTLESDLAILRWQRLMEQALTGLNSQVMPATHDEALGLLAYVEPAFERIELAAGWRYIYGPARAVKGLSRGNTRFGTDAVIYPTSW
jgi:hypothetical protein